MAMVAAALDLVNKRISTIQVDASTRGAYTDLLSDRLYSAIGSNVIPMFTGSTFTGLYRTGKLVNNAFPKMAWLRLDGPVTSAVVRIYRSGTLWYTTPTLTTEPVRLPAGMSREIEIEIESTSRITAIVMASSTDELQATS